MKKIKVAAKSQPQVNTKSKSTANPNVTTTLSIICAVFAFLLYANTLNHEYAFDDYPTIYGNRITMQGFAGIPTLMHTAFWYGLDGQNDWLYRPVSMVMFAAEWGIAPNKPAFSHWMNVLWYALTAFVLFKFLVNVFEGKNLLLPFAATMLWIAHPLHTEVIANIKSRDEIMCFLFCILSLNNLLNYIKHSQFKQIVYASVFYFMALMSKESAITMLAVIPLLIYVFTNTDLKRNVLVSSIALIPAVVYIILRGMVLTSQLNLGDIPLIDNSLAGAHGDFNLEKGTAFYILGRYILLLFFPHPLSSDYSFNAIPLVGLSNPLALFALLFYTGAGIYALIRLPKKDPVAFGILYYIITMSVVANVLFLTRSTMADRFLYMPSLGFAIIVIVLIARLLKIDLNSKVDFARVANLINYNKSFTYTIGVIVLLASVKTIARNPEWKNDTTIFSADVEHTPGSSRLRFLYGNHMIQEVKQKKVGPDQYDNYYNIAIEQLTKCIEIHPDYYEAYFGLGDLYTQKGQPEKALTYYQTVVHRLPDLAMGYNNLGNMYFKMNKFDSAIVALQKAVKLMPNYTDAYNNLGSAYFGKADYDNAIVNYKKTIELSPDYVDAWKNLGSSYGSKREFDKSIEAFQKALSLDPNNADVKKFLDITYQLQKQAAQ